MGLNIAALLFFYFHLRGIHVFAVIWVTERTFGHVHLFIVNDSIQNLINKIRIHLIDIVLKMPFLLPEERPLGQQPYQLYFVFVVLVKTI